MQSMEIPEEKRASNRESRSRTPSRSPGVRVRVPLASRWISQPKRQRAGGPQSLTTCCDPASKKTATSPPAPIRVREPDSGVSRNDESLWARLRPNSGLSRKMESSSLSTWRVSRRARKSARPATGIRFRKGDPGFPKSGLPGGCGDIVLVLLPRLPCGCFSES